MNVSQQKNSTSFVQFSLYGLGDENIIKNLFKRLSSLTPHPVVTYEHTHIVTLQYAIENKVQGRSRVETLEVKLQQRSGDPYSVVRWEHEIRNAQSVCEVKSIDECVFLQGHGLPFLQSLGATLKSEYVEFDVKEITLESGIVVRVFQLGKCTTPLNISTMEPLHESNAVHVVEVRGICQQENERQMEDAMVNVINSLGSIIELSKHSH